MSFALSRASRPHRAKTLAHHRNLDYALGHKVMNLSTQILWFAAQFIQTGVLVALFARGWLGRYPAFTAYVMFNLLSGLFLTLARDNWPYVYYFGYWVTGRCFHPTYHRGSIRSNPSGAASVRTVAKAGGGTRFDGRSLVHRPGSNGPTEIDYPSRPDHPLSF